MNQFTKDIQGSTHFLATIYVKRDKSVHTRFLILYDGPFSTKGTLDLQDWCEARYGLKNHPLYYIIVDLVNSVNYTKVMKLDERLQELQNE